MEYEGGPELVHVPHLGVEHREEPEEQVEPDDVGQVEADVPAVGQQDGEPGVVMVVILVLVLQYQYTGNMVVVSVISVISVMRMAMVTDLSVSSK